MNRLNLIKAILLVGGFKIVIELVGLLTLLIVFFENDLTMLMWASTLLQLFVNLVLLGAVLIFMHLVGALRELKSGTKTYSVLLVGFVSVVLGVGFVCLQTPLNHLYSYLPGQTAFTGFMTGHKVFETWLLPMLIGKVLIVPLFEELFFRGFILKRMLPVYNWKVALIVSAILFGLIHLPDVTQSMTTFLGGLIAGGLYLKTSRISAPIVFHISWNFTVYALDYVEVPFF